MEKKALPVGETAEYEDEDHEPCLYGWKDGKHYWFKNRKQTTILEFDKPLKSAEHPTMKPNSKHLKADYGKSLKRMQNELKEYDKYKGGE